ncbi:unnamed protein product, partial [Rotaria sp. Silwood1]
SNTTLPTLSLLSDDISCLSQPDWVLLSNVVHAFDTFSPVSEVQFIIEFLIKNSVDCQFILQQSQNIVNIIFQSIQSCISSTADFRIMTTDEQCSLVQ